MAFEPKNITRDHVLKAIDKIESDGIGLIDSTRWLVEINGKQYPPKEVMRYAHEQMNGERIWERSGGEPTNSFLENMGFKVIDKTNDPIKSIIELYKEHIRNNGFNDESYKWKLVNKLKGRPDVNAQDFSLEIKEVNPQENNMVYQMAKATSNRMAKYKPEEYRACFRKLFDETLDLDERISDFMSETISIYKSTGGENSAHHDERTISAYLTFYYPEKYTFYKSSYYNEYCKLLGIQPKDPGKKYVHYLELIHELIDNYILQDTELLNIVDTELQKGDYFTDKNLLLLAQDILYTQLIIKNIINTSNFNAVIAEVKRVSEEDDSTDLFVFQKPKSKWVWISDKQNIIGDLIAHYEISLDKPKGKYTVDIHFEGKEKGQFKEIIDNLPDEVSPITWQGSKSIRYGNGLPPEEPDLINKLIEQLVFLEVTFGDRIRNIIRLNNTIMENQKLKKESLNQILFGPPGTGKTYNTINKAIEIINPVFFAKNKNSYEVIHEEFDRLLIKDFDKTEGQIAFCTFHQSFTYEDFVEGIKPLKPIDGEQLKYDVQAGVFKKICELAGEEKELISLENAYESFKNEVVDNDFIVLKTPTHEKPFRVVINSNGNCIATPQTNIQTEMVISKAMIFDYLLNDNIRDWKPYLLPICNYIKTKYKFSLEISNNFKKPYVLIIDEINRGNVSSIFGELITLIESNKRKGEKETLEVILPYSKQPFTVPANLYIIGTMNTADRSVEALDAALRRRFSFVEMPSKPELVAPNRCFWELLWKYEGIGWQNIEYKAKEKELLGLLGASDKLWKDRKDLWGQFSHEGKKESQIDLFPIKEFTGINFESILTKINLRIEKLLDKDHQIGHSYFMSVETTDDLKSAFKNKIIPLLQEYFFGDYGKIGLVLGSGFVSAEPKDNNVFAKFESYDASDFTERVIYKIANVEADEFDIRIAIESLLK